jgi:S-DNA-T family DNA segregation ATPase FtsK/SpoIIIE
VVLLSAFGGVLAFRRSRQALKIQWGRVIALELSVFLTLAVLAVVSGYRLTEDGMWGGQIGWGLAMLFSRSPFPGPFWGGLIVFILWGLMLVSTFGFWHPIENWLLGMAGMPAGSIPVMPVPDMPAVSPLPEGRTAATAGTGKRGPQKLPPEFRKSFKVSEQQDSRSIAPPPRGERLPPLNVLLDEQAVRPDERTINQVAGLIEKSLSEFGIPAKVVGFRIGPTVTQFAVQPGFIKKGTEEDAQQMKVRVAQIASLQKDLALALSAERLRIEAPVPGRAYVGLRSQMRELC